MSKVCQNWAETERFARSFLSELKPNEAGPANGASATVIGLIGELGSGKTAFTQAVARGLGIEEAGTSPTFVIQKFYPVKSAIADHGASPFFEKLIHVDAYRLNSPRELLALGWNKIIKVP